MEHLKVKDFVDDLRIEWKSLWQNRIDDKVRAEGIAKEDYSKLSVEKGTVIIATRDYKPLEFYDIVEDYLGAETGKTIVPNTTVGGWGKFIRTNIKKTKRTSKRAPPPRPAKPKGNHKKKGGRGWLHANL
jgi:hypothetical protein